MDTSLALLSHIPEIQLASIPAETGCCGAAGSFMLTQAALASTIRDTTLDSVKGLDAEIVTTCNIGCGLHLHAGLGNKLTVTHPVSLLAQQIISS